MNKDVMDAISGNGFLKITRPELPRLTGAEKAVLVRKGNELFNAGKLDEAKKIFLTAGYSDGLIRIGDKLLEKHQTVEAFRMYCMAPDEKKKDMMIHKFASIIRNWLKENRFENKSQKKEQE